MNLFRLKKWYFDTILETGDVLYFYFMRIWLAGFNYGMVSVFLSKPNNEHQKFSETIISPIEEENNRLVLGNNTLQVDKAAIKINIQLKDLCLNSCFSSFVPCWCPGNDGILLTRSQQVATWIASLPMANVTGVLTMQGVEIEVNGKGYHDLVEMNIAPWHLPLAKLWWGRAHGEDFTVVYNKLDFKGAENSNTKVLIWNENHVGSSEGYLAENVNHYIKENNEFSLEMSEAQSQTVLSDSLFTLNLDHQRIIENTPLATDDRIKFTILRNLVETISGSPHQVRFLSAATLSTNKFRKRGQAIHELVTWNWQR